MKRIFFIIFLSYAQLIKAQSDSTVSLDQLQVPSSPAFNVLGISPNSIERPKNPTDFALALGNATSGFTTIPKDYAVEFAPYWVFTKKQPTFRDFVSYKKAGINILQTATISAGTTSAISQIDSSEFRKVAVALKFSIFRGQLKDEFKEWNDSVSIYLHKSSEILGQIRAHYADSLTSRLNTFRNNLKESTSDDERKKWKDSINSEMAAIPQKMEQFEAVSLKIAQDSVQDYNEAISHLKLLASRTDFKRYGFKLDFALGTAMDYPDSNFQTCYVSKFSSWLTGGWESPNFNILGVARFSENINRRFKNDSNVIINDVNIGELDYGFRIYKDFTEKFTMSVEYLRRLPFFNSTRFDKNNITKPESTNRYIISLNYKVGKNQNLSFVYGKDFDKTYIKQGNLVAALNLLIGFGSSRPFGSK